MTPGCPPGSDRLDGTHKTTQYPRMPPGTQPPPTPSPTPQRPSPTTSATRLELWEADLVALLRVGTAGAQVGPGRKKAQEFADSLDAVRL